MSDESLRQSEGAVATSAWHITKVICCLVVAVSVLSCVAVSAVRSIGLAGVTVTALSGDAEPRDHGIPLLKQKDALPDYQIVVNLSSGRKIDLGAKPNTSAVDGLTWTLNDPVSIAEVASVRLQEQDMMIADAIVEVQITGDSVSTDNYKFEFTTSRSASVGVRSFFLTPIGMAISAAFFVAVVLMLVSSFAA